MNTKRPYLKLLMSSVSVGLFLANCTVKESQSDECEKGDKDTGCECADGSVGYQVCNSSGVFGSCQCPDANTAGTSGNTAGTSSNGGSSSTDGGTSSATAGKTYTAGTDAGGAPTEPAAGGAGGAPLTFDPENCEECLQVLCEDDFTACFADETCFAQYQAIIGCIDDERINGLVKRDVVRACGVSIGSSSTGNLQDAWAPADLDPKATNLINCMATRSSETPNADWANSDDNFPVVNDMVVPAPWPDDSCAKLSCTSKFQ